MKIDLGQKYNSGPCCAPASDDKEGKVSYPSLYFTHDEPVDVPEEGTATITFRRVDYGENTRDPEDPKYRCEIEVRSIDIKGADKGDGMVSVGDALKKAMRKKIAEKMGAGDEE